MPARGAGPRWGWVWGWGPASPSCSVVSPHGKGQPSLFSSFSTRKRLRCFHSSSPAICAAGRSGSGTGETLLPGERGEGSTNASMKTKQCQPSLTPQQHPGSPARAGFPSCHHSVPLPALLFLFNAVKSRLVPTGPKEGSGKVTLLPCNRASQNPQKYWKIKSCLLGCCMIY